MPKNKSLIAIPDEKIIGQIYMIRGKKVMFDRDLAKLYGVENKVLNQAVKRNLERFPEDFMFKLSKEEMAIWKSQIVTSKGDLKGLRKPLSVFTEQGVAMLSAVLKSQRAIEVSIQIIRTFVKLREILSTHKQLQEKMELLEKKYDKNFKVVFEIISRLMKEDAMPKERIGFKG